MRTLTLIGTLLVAIAVSGCGQGTNQTKVTPQASATPAPLDAGYLSCADGTQYFYQAIGGHQPGRAWVINPDGGSQNMTEFTYTDLADAKARVLALCK